MKDGAPTDPLNWQEKSVETHALKFTPNNPRQISTKNFTSLKDKIKRYGYHDRIKVQPDLTMIGGNMRLRALIDLNIQIVPVLIASRALTDAEMKDLIVTDNLHDGEWDMNIISSTYDANELIGLGFPEGLIDYPEDSKEEKKKVSKEESELAELLDFCPHCGHAIPSK